MDHFGEDTLAGVPPNLMAGDPTEPATPASHDVTQAPDIDVPFTPSAQRVIDRCVELADLVGGKAILTEHLLLAIASTPECAAAKLIAEHDLSSESMLAALQFVLGNETKLVPDHHPSPRLERVIIRAKREAFRHHHPEVSTLHLLMALIRERAGVALYALERPGTGYQKIANANRHAVRAGESD